MSVSNMVKMGLVVGAMAVLTGCAPSMAVVKTGDKVNLKVEATNDVASVINVEKVKQNLLKKMQNKGVSQSENGTLVILKLSNFRIKSMQTGSTGIATNLGSSPLALINTILTTADNVSNVSDRMQQKVSGVVDYTLQDSIKEHLNASITTNASLESVASEMENSIPNTIDMFVDK
jgi:hypothetical protein